MTSSPTSGRKALAVFMRLFWGSAVALIGSIGVAVFVHVNTHALPGVPWFLIPAAVLCVVLFRRSEPPKSTVRPVLNSWHAALISGGLAVALGVVALLATGLPQVFSGSARLPGDVIEGTALFQALASFATVGGAAVVEEAAIRGQLQLRLPGLVSAGVAEAISDVLFVLLHFLRFGSLGEMVYVSILSLACGRVAALTQSIRWPAATHLGANLIVLGVVLANRGWH